MNCPTTAANAHLPTALVVAEAVLQAMGSLVPDKTIAEGSGSGAIALGGRARNGKHALAPQGIDGGHPGGTGGCVINPGRDDERSMPSRFGDQRLRNRRRAAGGAARRRWGWSCIQAKP